MSGRNHAKLTYFDRKIIEHSLNNGSSFSEIGRQLDVKPSTVSREVRRNRAVGDECPARNHINKNLCKKKERCRIRALCPGGCLQLCSECKKALCNKVCPDYEPKTCTRTQHAPYVCNNCWKILGAGCGCLNYYYDGKIAHLKAEERRVVARKGIDCSEDELIKAVELVKPLLKKGQSLDHIWATHSGELPCSKRTFYRYINQGALEIINMDLPKKVTYKIRKKKKTADELVDRAIFKGRTYDDYKQLDPFEIIKTCEMDCVVGKRHESKVIMTIYIRRIDFQLMVLLPEHTKAEVVKAIDLIESFCEGSFSELFGIILADRGSEFLDAEGIETNESGNKRCSLYYCDALKPGQKGACEKNHVEIRKIIPKGTSFENLTARDVSIICSHVNSYTRPALGGKSPMELALLLLPEELLVAFGLELIPPDDVHLKPDLLNLDKR